MEAGATPVLRAKLFWGFVGIVPFTNLRQIQASSFNDPVLSPNRSVGAPMRSSIET